MRPAFLTAASLTLCLVPGARAEEPLSRAMQAAGVARGRI